MTKISPDFSEFFFVEKGFAVYLRAIADAYDAEEFFFSYRGAVVVLFAAATTGSANT
jgi:hypothetical protein